MSTRFEVDREFQVYDKKAEAWKSFPIETGVDIRIRFWKRRQRAKKKRTMFLGKIHDIKMKTDIGGNSTLDIHCRGLEAELNAILYGMGPMPGTYAYACEKLRKAFENLILAIDAELHPWLRPSTWLEVLRQIHERIQKK